MPYDICQLDIQFIVMDKFLYTSYALNIMVKTNVDYAYEKGVREGLDGDIGTDLLRGLSNCVPFSGLLNSPESEASDKGYSWGAQNRYNSRANPSKFSKPQQSSSYSSSSSDEESDYSPGISEEAYGKIYEIFSKGLIKERLSEILDDNPKLCQYLQDIKNSTEYENIANRLESAIEDGTYGQVAANMERNINNGGTKNPYSEVFDEEYPRANSTSNYTPPSKTPDLRTPEQIKRDNEMEFQAVTVGGCLLLGLVGVVLIASALNELGERTKRFFSSDKSNIQQQNNYPKRSNVAYASQLEIETQQQNEYIKMQRKIDENQSKLRALRLDQEKEKLEADQTNAQKIYQERDEILTRIIKQKEEIVTNSKRRMNMNAEFYQDASVSNTESNNVLPENYQPTPFTLDYAPYLNDNQEKHKQFEPKYKTQARMAQKYKKADKRRDLVNRLNDPYR